MNPSQQSMQGGRGNKQTQTNGNTRDGTPHTHRTAKIVELVGASTKSFDDALQNCLRDASASTRGITGCSVEHFSVKCENGKITEYRVNVKVSFGIERTPPSDSNE